MRLLFIIEVRDGKVYQVVMTDKSATIDHLERAGNPKKYNLSAEGKQKAQELVDSLTDY